MTTFPYSLVTPPSPSPAPYGSSPGYLYSGTPTPCTPSALSPDQLLEVARRALGPYAADLEEAGRGGWDFLRACARMWSRISLAIGRFDCESFPTSATGPALATVPLRFQRPTAAAGIVTIRAGSLVRSSASGAMFRTAADVVFSIGDTGPHTVDGIAIGYGEEFNVAGQYISPGGDVWAGEVDTCDLLLLDPVFSDQSITVINVAEGTGGSLGILDVHGSDVDVPRLPGEADPAYMTRVMAAPDRVSPAAVRRQVAAFMASIGYTAADYSLIEVPTHEFLACYDAPETTFTFRPEYDPTRFVFDDARQLTPIRNRWVDAGTREGAGILEIRDLCAVEDAGLAFDDPADFRVELATALGTRATPVYDHDDGITLVRPGAHDGGDRKRDLIYKRLGDMLATIKAHGVVFDLVARGD